jgi:hypothetical protein
VGRHVLDRWTRYVDLAAASGAKLTAGDYHADDLVDDWFRWVGLVAQDVTAAVTLVVRVAAAPPDEASPPRPRG